MKGLIYPAARQVVAIDYDNMITLDIQLWSKFIRMFRAAGFEPIVVTWRFESERAGMHPEITQDPELQVVCTGRKAKRAYCEALRINVAIWIDDMPEAILYDMEQLQAMRR